MNRVDAELQREPFPVEVYQGLMELLWDAGEREPNGTVSCRKQQCTFEVAFEVRVARSLCVGLSGLLTRPVVPQGRKISLSVEEAALIAALPFRPWSD
jgi:hypothetical protein